MRRARVIVATACLVTLAGCGGGGGSNDQGVSFRALGVFQETLEQFAPAADTFPTADNAVGDSGRTIILEETNVFPTDVNGDGDLDGGFIGLQNLMTTQRLNVQGVDVEVIIPGARLPRPSGCQTTGCVATDFVPLSVTIVPAPTDPTAEATNVVFVQTLFLSSDILAFLNQNRPQLPNPPYNINVVMRATATTDAGDNLESNEFTYGITVLPNPNPGQ